MDCIFGLVAASSAVLGTIVGALVVYASHPANPRVDGVWLAIVVPIAAYFIGGAVIGSAVDSLVRRFRPAGEADVLSHDGGGSDPPTWVVFFLGSVFLLAPALVAIVLMLFGAGLVG